MAWNLGKRSPGHLSGKESADSYVKGWEESSSGFWIACDGEEKEDDEETVGDIESLLEWILFGHVEMSIGRTMDF